MITSLIQKHFNYLFYHSQQLINDGNIEKRVVDWYIEAGNLPGTRPVIVFHQRVHGGQVPPYETITHSGQVWISDARSSSSGPTTCRWNHGGLVQRELGRGQRRRPQHPDNRHSNWPWRCGMSTSLSVKNPVLVWEVE